MLPDGNNILRQVYGSSAAQYKQTNSMRALTLDQTTEATRSPICWKLVANRAAKVLIIVNCIAILTFAVWLRCWRLGTIPGINGDEAWYGVQAQSVLHGESIAWRTPTGNPLNPFFMGMC